MKLKPYPEYQDSGVPWLGEIPKHWQVLRIKNIFQETDERSSDGKGTLLSLTRVRGLLPQTEATNRLASAEDLSKYKVCKPRQLVMNRMQAWSGMFAVSSQEGLVSPDYSVFCAQDTAQVFYFEHLFKTPLYVDQFAQQSKGIGSGFNRLYTPDFGAIPLVVPPKEEQEHIVGFLAHSDRLGNRLIRAKRQLIELLNEQKRAMIHRAVTCGLDPNVHLKPSGIDWLGDVPEHWDVAPLRRFAIKRCDGPFGSGLKSMHYTPEGVRVIRLQNIGHSEFRDRDAAYISPEHYASLGDHDVIRGDLLIAGLGDERIPAGRACVAPDNIEPAMVKADCFRFRLNTGRAEPQFVAFQLSATAVNASAILSTGATRQRINLQTTAGRAIAIPPIHEQQEIVVHVTSSLRPLEKAIAQANREIDLLREYCTRLIADVVTGKLDVRGVELPVLDEADTLDDMDTGEDAEVNDTDTVEESMDE